MKTSELIGAMVKIMKRGVYTVVNVYNANKTLFAIEISNDANELLVPCPVCNTNPIEILFTEDDVFDCCGHVINPERMSICQYCLSYATPLMFAKMMGLKVWKGD